MDETETLDIPMYFCLLQPNQFNPSLHVRIFLHCEKTSRISDKALRGTTDASKSNSPT